MSPRPRDAADAFKTIDRDDAQTLIDIIQAEVRHGMADLVDRLHEAEAQVNEYAQKARQDLKTARRRTGNAVRANPIPTGLLVAGAGILLVAILMQIFVCRRWQQRRCICI